jgi:hypothetical protein
MVHITLDQRPFKMVLKYQQVLKISCMLEFLINVTNQKLLLEEMCTEFDAMCKNRERHAVLKFLMHNL